MSRKIYLSKKPKEIQEELENMDSDLVNYSYKASFDVPADFWENQKTQLTKELEVNSKDNFRRLDYRWLSAAAAILLLIVWFLPSTNKIESNELSLDTIELSALEEYLLDEVESMDSRLSLEETFYDQELWIQDDE